MPVFFRSSCSALVLALVGLALPVVGCGSSDSNAAGNSAGSSGSSGATASGAQAASADECARRCGTKFAGCGASAADAKSACAAQVCGETVTTDQLTCLEGKACDQISSSASFVALCPASAGSTTPTQPTPPAAAKCGTATCATGEYCGLTYDSGASTWTPSACKKIPAACTSKTAQDLCTCMQANSGCATSGVVSTKCSQADSQLSFGCN